VKGAGSIVDLDKTLVVTEIFKSVQGESTWAGLPCAFVRLTGCDVRCTYCDTQYAYEGGDTMTIGAILDRCAALACSLVTITGGEPLQQEHCPALAACLLERGFTVLCETSGTLPITKLPTGVIKIMDLKCPSSGACDKNDWSNVEALSLRDEVKFVLADRGDYEWSRDVVRRYTLTDRCKAVLFSPVFGQIEPRQIADWILADGLDVRLHVQLHKYIWPADQGGV